MMGIHHSPVRIEIFIRPIDVWNLFSFAKNH